jgi:hypothetical protein
MRPLRCAQPPLPRWNSYAFGLRLPSHARSQARALGEQRLPGPSAQREGARRPRDQAVVGRGCRRGRPGADSAARPYTHRPRGASGSTPGRSVAHQSDLLASVPVCQLRDTRRTGRAAGGSILLRTVGATGTARNPIAGNPQAATRRSCRSVDRGLLPVDQLPARSASPEAASSGPQPPEPPRGARAPRRARRRARPRDLRLAERRVGNGGVDARRRKARRGSLAGLVIAQDRSSAVMNRKLEVTPVSLNNRSSWWPGRVSRRAQ